VLYGTMNLREADEDSTLLRRLRRLTTRNTRSRARTRPPIHAATIMVKDESAEELLEPDPDEAALLVGDALPPLLLELGVAGVPGEWTIVGVVCVPGVVCVSGTETGVVVVMTTVTIGVS
jgi:hypothetical protein